jgi:hypothetical protein
MIPVIIFYLHTIFAVYAFCKSFQVEGLLQAFLNTGFIIILFSVGWTISDLFVGFVISPNGYLIDMPVNKIAVSLLKISGFFTPGQGKGTLNPKDSISLIVLSVMEYYFYKFYFRETKAASQEA